MLNASHSSRAALRNLAEEKHLEEMASLRMHRFKEEELYDLKINILKNEHMEEMELKKIAKKKILLELENVQMEIEINKKKMFLLNLNINKKQ